MLSRNSRRVLGPEPAPKSSLERAKRAALPGLQKDPDPAVAEAAGRASAAVEMAFKQEQLFGKR